MSELPIFQAKINFLNISALYKNDLLQMLFLNLILGKTEHGKMNYITSNLIRLAFLEDVLISLHSDFYL